MAKATTYYIKERINYNGGHYFVPYGLTGKGKAKSIETGSLGGTNIMHPYSTEEEYLKRLEELETEGRTIYEK